VLFFVSVGMLFDPAVLLDWPGRVLAIVAVIVAGKALAAFAIVAAYRYPARVGLTVAAGLSQIGEFSFILVAVGSSLGLFPAEGTNLVLAGALLSITLNPLLFAVVEPLARRLERRPESEPDAGRLVECDRDGVTAAATE
jgi:CPA2 family monovalent cation:H+ antiporter-2